MNLKAVVQTCVFIVYSTDFYNNSFISGRLLGYKRLVHCKKMTAQLQSGDCGNSLVDVEIIDAYITEDNLNIDVNRDISSRLENHSLRWQDVLLNANERIIRS